MGNDTNATSVGSRLRSERTRLGFNIRDFAEKAGVGKSTQGNYENDVGLPDADYLNRIAALGAEVFWIMRGEKEDDEARDKRVAMYPPEVRELIENYEFCPDEVKAALRVIAKNAADQRRTTAKDFKKKTGGSAAVKPADEEIDLLGPILRGEEQ